MSDDPDDAELGGVLKAELMEDICGTLSAFAKQYGGHTAYAAQEKRSKQRQKLMHAYQKKKKKLQQMDPDSAMHADRGSAARRNAPASKQATKRASASPTKTGRE